MDSCDKVISTTANDTASVGYYAHYILKIKRAEKADKNDTLKQQLTKSLEVKKMNF